jgi:enoyl-CoA hydratase/carnithine racemase
MSVLTFEKRDNVALIGLNDPEHLNAFSMAMLEELHEVLVREAAGRHPALRLSWPRTVVLVRRAHGRLPADAARRPAEQRAPLLRIGAEDHRDGAHPAASDDVFGDCDPRLGGRHGRRAGPGVRLHRRRRRRDAMDAGDRFRMECRDGRGEPADARGRRGWARRILLLNEKVPAKTAHDIGLVARLVPAGKVVDEALAIIAQMDRHSPLATQYQKKLLDILPNVAIDDSMELEIITGYWLAHHARRARGGAGVHREAPPRLHRQLKPTKAMRPASVSPRRTHAPDRGRALLIAPR